MEKKSVMLVVTTNDPQTLTRAFETLARAAAGLVMEDIPVVIMSSNDMIPLGGE